MIFLVEKEIYFDSPQFTHAQYVLSVHIDELKISRQRSAEKFIKRGVFNKTGSHGREYGNGTIDSNCQ